MRTEKAIIKHFYDSFGWQKDAAGRYNDTALYVDMRRVSIWYRHKAHLRVARWFGRGRYFLDAGSGPIEAPEYLIYSSGYQRRVCVDLSETALREARARLGDKGWYVLADLARLPFRDGVFDAAVSAHVLYHVPSDEQGTVLTELYRMLGNAGLCVIIYNQFAGLSAKVELFRVCIGRARRLARRIMGGHPRQKLPATSIEGPPLYVYAHDRTWFERTLPREWNVDIRCWSMVDQAFIKNVPENVWGRCLLGMIYCVESVFPHALAWVGYQTIIIRKAEGLGRSDQGQRTRLVRHEKSDLVSLAQARHHQNSRSEKQ